MIKSSFYINAQTFFWYYFKYSTRLHPHTAHPMNSWIPRNCAKMDKTVCIHSRNSPTLNIQLDKNSNLMRKISSGLNSKHFMFYCSREFFAVLLFVYKIYRIKKLFFKYISILFLSIKNIVIVLFILIMITF